MALFLTTEEVADLTGIRKGRNGVSRDQLQCQHLRAYGIPFFPNASGQPKVARAFIEGNTPAPVRKQVWQSSISH